MKKLTIAALLAGQIAVAAQPAFAADFVETREQRAGAFAGFRLRMPLDGPRRQRQVRAGLAIAPALQSRFMDGEIRSRIGEGFEFGYRSGRPLSFSIAGQDLSGRRLGAAQDSDDGEHHDHTVRTVLLVAGGVVVIAAVATVVVFESILANEDS